MFFSPALLCGVLIFGGCKPSRMHSSGPYTGKVIGDICSQFTIQLVSGNMDTTRYLKTWKNTQSDSVYHNVFALKNFCYFSSLHLQRGAIFQFDLIPDGHDENCAVCLIYEPTPPVSNSIKVTQTNK